MPATSEKKRKRRSPVMRKALGGEMPKHMSNLASDMEATTNPNKVSKKRKKKKRRSPEMAKALRY